MTLLKRQWLSSREEDCIFICRATAKSEGLFLLYSNHAGTLEEIEMILSQIYQTCFGHGDPSRILGRTGNSER